MTMNGNVLTHEHNPFQSALTTHLKCEVVSLSAPALCRYFIFSLFCLLACFTNPKSWYLVSCE